MLILLKDNYGFELNIVYGFYIFWLSILVKLIWYNVVNNKF